jgi:hypothetical protein
VLIVDDFAMREHTFTQSDDLDDLVSDRAIAAKPLILTSNRDANLLLTQRYTGLSRRFKLQTACSTTL